MRWILIIVLTLASLAVARTPTTQPMTDCVLSEDAPVGLKNIWEDIQNNRRAKAINAGAGRQLNGMEAALATAKMKDRPAMRRRIAAVKLAITEAEQPCTVEWPVVTRTQPGCIGSLNSLTIRRIIGRDAFVANPMNITYEGEGPYGSRGIREPMYSRKVSTETVLVRGFDTTGLEVGQLWATPTDILVRMAEDRTGEPFANSTCDRFDPLPFLSRP